MRKALTLGVLSSIFLLTACQPQDCYKEAIAFWTFSDLNDQTTDNSVLKTHGDISLLTLDGFDKKESIRRGGDGIAAQFKNAWFDAGQGLNEELNLTGKQISLLVRMKLNMVDAYMPLFNKAGDDQSVAYSIALNTVDGNVYVEAMIGSDDIGGAHLLKYKLPKEELNQWHDIFFRFNGKISQLYVDGLLRDDEVTVGEIRDWNRKPLLIGAQYKLPYGYAEVTDEQVESKFDGLIDHVALWNRYLSDDEVAKLSGVTELKDGRPEYYKETYRPQFHFTAKKNWLNDPNGLVYYDGTYHMFYQYMPPHRPGAYKDWGHAISRDLVHWTQTDNPITPHKVWSGCWSGSAVVDENNTAGFQIGDKKTIVVFITNGSDAGAGLGPLCTQCIAYSTDGGNTFTYYDQNPVIRNIHNANRDPKVVWDDVSSKWIMSLYMDKGNDFGLFSSSDLKEWKYLSTVSIEGVTECPGFEALPVDGNSTNKKWLFFGANGNHIIGSFDGTNFKPETKVLRADYGMNFYAAQTWSNSPDGRCIHLAWMPTKRYPNMPFEQQMNFPTELKLRNTSDGIRMFRMPVAEISTLYDKTNSLNNVSIKEGENLFKEMNGELYDIDLEIEPRNAISFKIGIRSALIEYDAVRKMISCGDPSKDHKEEVGWWTIKRDNISPSNNLGEAPLTPIEGKIKLRILVDRTTIEIFGNDGQVVISSCFMPEENNRSYSLTSQGEVKLVKAEVRSLQSSWDN